MKRLTDSVFFWLVIVGFLFLLIFSYCKAVFADWEDCVDATCRITVGNSRGTGCCYIEDDEYYYVVTCRHVVGNGKTAKCEFWHGGQRQSPVIGTVYSKSTKYDVASIRIPKDAFNGYKLTPVPLAPRDYIPKPLDAVISVGCANGNWPTLWRGHVVSYDSRNGNAGFTFQPRPAKGRSGSAVFDADGEHIIALLWGCGNTGVAVTLPAIYDSLVKTEEKELKRVVYFFSSKWCSGCRKQKETLHQLAEEGLLQELAVYGWQTVLVESIGDPHVEQFGIQILPSIVATEEGEVVARAEGTQSIDQLRALIEALIERDN